MKETIITSDKMLPVLINAGTVKWTVIGGGQDAMEQVRAVVQHAAGTPLTVIAADAEDHLKEFIDAHENIGTQYGLGSHGNLKPGANAGDLHFLRGKSNRGKYKYEWNLLPCSQGE